MSQQVTAPDEGDEIELKDGRKGLIGDPDSFVWNGGSDWEVTVIVKGEPEGDEEEGDEEEVNEVNVRPDDGVEGLWKEI